MTSAGSWLTAGAVDDPLVVLRSDFWAFNAIGIIGTQSACAVDPGARPLENVSDAVEGPLSDFVVDCRVSLPARFLPGS
jgi:hypothetical protein